AAYISNEVHPNSRLNLTIYNMFNTKDGVYKKDGIRNVGEPPHILDSSLVDLSTKQINRFLQTKGYFNAEVTPLVFIKNKKAHVDFNVSLGQPFNFGKITHKIDDIQVRNLYEEVIQPRMNVRTGQQFNSSELLEDRELLYSKMKENGYYDYLRQYMRVGIDTISTAKLANLLITVDDPADSVSHTVYQIDSVSAKLLLPLGQTRNRKPITYFDSTLNISFEDQTGRFRLRPISKYIYIRPGINYNLKKEVQSYDRLYEMNGFRNVKINYQKVDSNRLNVVYELTPRPVMANQVEGE